MAQIHALTPEGRLPSRAVEHVRELVDYRSGARLLPLATGQGWTGGRVTLCRVGPGVTVAVTGITQGESQSSYVNVIQLPSGFRPHDTLYVNTDRGLRCRIDTAGNIQVYAAGTAWDAFHFTFTTLNSPPATPPGSNA